MKTTTRESAIWDRSADQHTRNNEPVAAAFSQHLSQMAQDARDEFDKVRVLAEAMHKAVQEARS